MYDAFKSMDDVSSMADVRARAEFLAWMTSDAYLSAGKHDYHLSRSERAAAIIKARSYRRRAVRVSRYANARL